MKQNGDIKPIMDALIRANKEVEVLKSALQKICDIPADGSKIYNQVYQIAIEALNNQS